MVKSVRHLGKYFDCTFKEQADCKIRKTQFIGLVNKLISNFQHLQRNVLFKTVAPFMDHLPGNINQRVSRNVPRV